MHVSIACSILTLKPIRDAFRELIRFVLQNYAKLMMLLIHALVATCGARTDALVLYTIPNACICPKCKYISRRLLGICLQCLYDQRIRSRGAMESAVFTGTKTDQLVKWA